MARSNAGRPQRPHVGLGAFCWGQRPDGPPEGETRPGWGACYQSVPSRSLAMALEAFAALS